MFEASRAKAINQLDNFVENNLAEYSRLRNFDFGPEKRLNVSCLSPYITHGIINEKEVIKKSLSKFSFSKNEKFIQEVLWRTYWKGWLELRPNVWTDYLLELDKIKNEFQNNQDYLSAIEGKTNIDCFNEWVNELKENNYLHNHTRMWFASIWIFTLNLPWQLGAEFFLKHLYDGDAASNLLSWRWVAGLQTKGKQYLFSPSNLRRFSNNRFNVEKINNRQILLEESNQIPYEDEIYKSNMEPKSKSLILFENDLHAPTLRNIFRNYKNVFIVVLENEQRKIKLSESVISFKQELVHEFTNQFDNVIKIDPASLKKTLGDIRQLDMIYPGIGENSDFISDFKIKNNKLIFNLVRDQDLFAWKFAKKGFFKFKENIPKINQFVFQN